MKKSIRNLTKAAKISLALSSCVFMLGCTGMHRQESTGQYVDNTVITAKVKAKLLADKSIHSFPITVNSYKNTVQLSGFVNSRFQSRRAVELAYSVPGVMNVQNSLIIKNR